jgi:hypothetical protein
MAGSYGHSNELPDSVTCGKFIDPLRNYDLRIKDSVLLI